MNKPTIHHRRSQYRLLGVVGQGQFGRVFCASHRHSGQIVALKCLEHERFSTHNFLRELRFLLGLQHPNIVPCYALEHTSTARYLVMDYAEGGTLRTLLESNCGLNLGQGLKLLLDILAGLGHAHGQGIVHCDIKPENILINVHPYGWTARLSDFGIARLLQDSSRLAGGATGSPAYMAPERFYGEYSPASDVYAVGILLYEILVGSRPFAGTPGELMAAHLNEVLTIPLSVPPPLGKVLTKSLRKLPGQRFHTAEEMSTAVQQVMSQLSASTLHNLLHRLPAASACPPVIILQQSLDQPVNKVIPSFSPTGIAWAAGPKLTWILLNEASKATILREPIVDVWGCPDRYLIATDQGLYHWKPGSVARQVLSLPPHCQVVVEPRGDWFATFSPTGSKGATLRFWKSADLGAPPVIATLPRIPRSYLLVPDRRHLVILTAKTARPGEATPSPGMILRLYNRRGQYLGSWSLPVLLEKLVLSYRDYRLLGTDPLNPYCVVIVDLKPFRIRRLYLGFLPVVLAALPWGFALANPEGAISLFDNYGESVGQIVWPTPVTITSISALDAQTLVVGTWDSRHGLLHWLDLKRMGLDLVF